MIIVGIIFVLCVYIVALIGKIFNLRDGTMAGLCMWVFLVVLGSIFYLLSSVPVETFR